MPGHHLLFSNSFVKPLIQQSSGYNPGNDKTSVTALLALLITLLLTSLVTAASPGEEPPAIAEPAPAADPPDWLAVANARWGSRDLRVLRNDYRQARAALDNRNYKEFRQLRATLDEYPLAGYLDYRFLLANPQQLNASSLETFERTHENARLAKYLKRKWLLTLVEKKDWGALITHFDPAVANTTLECGLLRARLQQDPALLDELLPDIRRLWLSPSSLPKACDPLFKRMIQGPGVTPSLAWQRFLLSYGAREIQLANYLVRYLDEPAANHAKQLLELYRAPAGVPVAWNKLRGLREFAPSGEPVQDTDLPSLVDAALLQLLKRLGRADDEAAIAMAPGMGDDPSAPAFKRYLLTRKALGSYRDVPALYQALQIDSDPQSYNWLLRAHIAAADWPALEQALENLPDAIADEERWQYWRLRAVQLQRQLSEEQRKALSALSGKASFYGFMSAQLLGNDYTFEPEFGVGSQADMSEFIERPALQRAIEHWLQDEPNSAHAEWRIATLTLDADQQLAAGYLARKLGWWNPAVNAAITAGAWQHYPLRFPNVFRDNFARAALNHGLPTSWIYATARQESALAPHVKSPAGALGLMQMLPSTASQVARENNISHDTDQLFEPRHAIRLASFYLAELHERFGQRALASAAYNAGPHRVQRWLEDLQTTLPADAWIETIRFNETRQYVQNVLSFSLIYQMLYGDNGALANEHPTKTAMLEEDEWSVLPLDKDG